MKPGTQDKEDKQGWARGKHGWSRLSWAEVPTTPLGWLLGPWEQP